MMGKVLIFTETIGGNGHYMAARSLEKALTQIDPKIETKLVCGLSLVSRKLERAIRHSYLHTLRLAPKLWGKAYAREHKLSQVFQIPLGQLLAHYLEERISCEKPDIVVCTHAFCLSALAELKAKYDFRLGAAITDFAINRFWLHEEVDFYFVGHDELRHQIHKADNKAEIIATGIPIDPLFNEVGEVPKHILRQKIGFQEQPPTLLLMGGGMGLGPLDRLIEKMIAEFNDTLQLIVVTGRNEWLRKKCETTYRNHASIHVFGYVDNLPHMIAACDLIVTKPGGLTSSEALAMGLPMLIIEPIPGQEERNSRFLLAQRVALRVNEVAHICRYIRPFIEDPHFYEAFKVRARRAGKPDSSRRAAEVIVRKLNQKEKNLV